MEKSNANEKLLEALNTIKAVCEDAISCDECPLSHLTTARCLLTKTPVMWTINNPTAMWKALY